MSTVQHVGAENNTELLEALPALATQGRAVPYIYGDSERVLINDPASIHKCMAVLVKPEGGLHVMNQRVMGEGLLVTNRLNLWKPHRLLIQRELSPRTVQIHEQGIIDRIVDSIRAWPVGREVAVRDEIGRVALDNLGAAVFGGDFGDFRDTVRIALELLVEAGDAAESGHPDPALEARLEDYIVRLETVVASLVDRRQSTEASRTHVLDVLVAATRTGDPVFADPFVRDESITLMMAGHDTTAFLICMAIYQLNKHPEVKERLAAEVRAARAAGVPASEFAFALPYAKQVAQETLRLYPPLPFTSRDAAEDFDVDGYRVTKGTRVTIAPWVTHRDASYFPDPLVFNPDRFAPENKASIPRNAYLPFGLGQRVCAGNHFAMLETAIIISIVAADVDLEFRSTTPQIDAPVTLRFIEPLTAYVHAVR